MISEYSREVKMLIYTLFFSCRGRGSSVSKQKNFSRLLSFSVPQVIRFCARGQACSCRCSDRGTASQRALGAELPDIKAEQADINRKPNVKWHRARLCTAAPTLSHTASSRRPQIFSKSTWRTGWDPKK